MKMCPIVISKETSYFQKKYCKFQQNVDMISYVRRQLPFEDINSVPGVFFNRSELNSKNSSLFPHTYCLPFHLRLARWKFDSL